MHVPLHYERRVIALVYTIAYFGRALVWIENSLIRAIVSFKVYVIATVIYTIAYFGRALVWIENSLIRAIVSFKIYLIATVMPLISAEKGTGLSFATYICTLVQRCGPLLSIVKYEKVSEPLVPWVRLQLAILQQP